MRAAAKETEHVRYRSVLKSTSLIGGASAANLVIGMVRTKFVAVLLGSSGVALAALYAQVVSLTSMISGFGIDTSGVRDIAEAAGAGDGVRLARTVITLRRTVLVTGSLGAALLTALSVPIARVTFGDEAHAWPIAVLGLALLFGAVATGQSCVIRGTRRVADLARVTVVSAVSGAVLSVGCYAALGLRGIVPALVLASAAALVTSWGFARRIPVAAVDLSWRELGQGARSLLGLGTSFMVAGAVGAATTYFVQSYLVRIFGLTGAGQYQAAFSLSGALVGFVLGAMAADYYPRLTAVAFDDGAIVREVNEQTQVAVLLAVPGLAAMMVFSPIAVRVFYAAGFEAAVPLLRWLTLGLLGRVLAWPLGFVVLARGHGRLFLATEATASAVQISAVLLFTRWQGLEGAAIAFMATYVAYTALMLLVMYRIAGRTWSRRTVRLAALATVGLAVVDVNAAMNPEPISRWSVGVLLVAAASWACLQQLLRRSGVALPDLASRFLSRGERT